MLSLFNFSSIFQGGQLTPFAPTCGRPYQSLQIFDCATISRFTFPVAPLRACQLAFTRTNNIGTDKNDKSNGVLHTNAFLDWAFQLDSSLFFTHNRCNINCF